MADVIWTADLERIAEELGLDHPDFDRLQSYVTLVRTYPMDSATPDDYIRENLEKWIEWETQSYYGEHESPADFVRYYVENYCELGNTPNWLAIDYQHTWDSALRHDFHFESIAENLGYVWAEVY